MVFRFCRRFHLSAAACVVLSGLALASCAGVTIAGHAVGPQAAKPPTPQTAPVQSESLPPPPAPPAAPAAAPVVPPSGAAAGRVKVALLLPLSGPSGALGQAMLNAAQMALFDMGDSQFVLLTRDTQGTPQQAAEAAQEMIAAGAQLILGPLLANEVEAVKPVAAAAHIPVIAFSTATQLAGDGTYLLSFLPREEVARITSYAHAQGRDRFAVLAPRSPYGEVVVAAFRQAVASVGATLTRADYYDESITDLGAEVRNFAADGADFDALLLPEGGTMLKALAPQLPYYKIDPDAVKFLGTGLWDEPGLGTEPSLAGGWYAAPAPGPREDFEKRYRELYKTPPPRLATLGYDATALATVLARQPQGPDFSAAAITNPSGFTGVDGIFRFHSDGLVQRGLAVLEVHRGAGTVLDPAPTSFQDLGY